MSKFYTNCQVLGNNILLRGYDNHKQILEKIPYEPTLFIKSNKKTEWKSLYEGEYLEPQKFTSIKEARDFKERYKDVHGFEIHGQDRWQYQAISDLYPHSIEYDMSLVRLMIFDIECISDSGFPNIQEASAPITLISIYNSINQRTLVLGLKDYIKQDSDDFEYMKFDSEKSLLKYFIAYNQLNKFDVWSGWNIEGFDIPYLVNRIVNLFGEDMAKKLSPFNHIREETTKIRGKGIQSYHISGIIELDYLELYKKFGTYSAKESYTLGFISQEELGETKVDLPGTSFRDNYDNHFQLFVQYNAIDTKLVKKLDDKKKLIDLAFSIGYLIKCNIEDVFKTVLPWEVFIYNHLLNKGIVIPPRKRNVDSDFDGGWVKEPIPGLYGWTMTFDFASLYPSIIRQWNISPETFVDQEPTSVNDWLDFNMKVQTLSEDIKERNLSVAANGTMYSRDRKGFLAELMEICMEGRKKAKKEMLRLKDEYERTKDSSLKSRIDALHNLQLALKILGNSAYGAIGNSGFMYYDYRMAEAITLTGQLSDRHLADKMNEKINSILKTKGTDYILFADTDSIALDVQPLVDKFCSGKSRDDIVKFLDKFGEDICQKVINASVDEVYEKTNAFDKVMASKREAIASKTLLRGKKNYGMYVHNSEGVSYDEPDLKIMGIEVVRSSTPKWCREKLKECIKDIFEKDEMYLRSKFQSLYDEFKKLKPEEVAFPRGVTDIDKWTEKSTYKKGTPIHVRAAVLYNIHTKDLSNYDLIANGDKIKFVYLKTPNPIHENIFGFPSAEKFPPELKLEKFVDYDTQFEKTFRDPLQSLTDCAKWSLEERASLDEFFG